MWLSLWTGMTKFSTYVAEFVDWCGKTFGLVWLNLPEQTLLWLLFGYCMSYNFLKSFWFENWHDFCHFLNFVVLRSGDPDRRQKNSLHMWCSTLSSHVMFHTVFTCDVPHCLHDTPKLKFHCAPLAPIYVEIIIFFHWHYSPLWALACRTMSFHFFLSATKSLPRLTFSTWKFLSTSSFHPFLGLPLRLVLSSSWVKIFLGILSSILSRWPNQLILSSSILSRWPNQLILCLLSILLHFLLCLSLLVLDSIDFSIPRFRI